MFYLFVYDLERDLFPFCWGDWLWYSAIGMPPFTLQSIMLDCLFPSLDDFLPFEVVGAAVVIPISSRIFRGTLNIRLYLLIHSGLKSIPLVLWQSIFFRRQSAIYLRNLSFRPGLPCTSKVVKVVFSWSEWVIRYLKDCSFKRFYFTSITLINRSCLRVLLRASINSKPRLLRFR